MYSTCPCGLPTAYRGRSCHAGCLPTTTHLTLGLIIPPPRVQVSANGMRAARPSLPRPALPRCHQTEAAIDICTNDGGGTVNTLQKSRRHIESHLRLEVAALEYIGASFKNKMNRSRWRSERRGGGVGLNPQSPMASRATTARAECAA